MSPTNLVCLVKTNRWIRLNPNIVAPEDFDFFFKAYPAIKLDKMM